MNQRIITYLAIGVVVIAALVALVRYLHSINIPILEPAGPIAQGELVIMIATVALCGVVVIPVFFLLFFFAWKYRAGGPAHVDHHPDWDHDSALAEFSWWIPPIVIILVLAVVAVNGSRALDPYKPLPGPTPMTIEVVALDWKWLFIYPAQGIASVNFVEFPTGEPVRFLLTAQAPMNSFWIPQLGGQIMVMPGMSTQLNLEASREGDFSGFSGNISGDGFSGMTFTARAVSNGDFNAWVRSVGATSTPLTMQNYEALAEPSEYNPVSYYSSPDPQLYNATIMQYMMPGMPLSQSASSAPSLVPAATSSEGTGMQASGITMPMQ